MHGYSRHWIGGEWVAPTTDKRIDVIDSTTEEILGSVPAGDASDINRAVLAARAGFEAWRSVSVEDRAAVLESLAEAIANHRDELAELIVAEVGAMPLPMTRAIQVGSPIAALRAFAETVRAMSFEETGASARILREPIGVAGCITPWNYPVHQVVAKLGAALAAGCAVVIKPSEVAPLSVFRLAEILDEQQLPPGVVNIVSGEGKVAGDALAVHPGADMISFTGSVAAGVAVAKRAADTVKRVTQELGGKSPSIILEDLDEMAFGRAVRAGVQNAFLNGGQTCSAWTRLLVPRSRYDEAVEQAVAVAESFEVGDPRSPTTKLGPLVSETQRDRVRTMIDAGLRDGARIVTGGSSPPPGLERGFFVRPTVFADVTEDMTIAREEIFGPVLVVMAFDDDDDAVRLANATHYGLSAAVWGAERDRAEAIARRLDAGQVALSSTRFEIAAPFGGYKRSGNGREMGRQGIEEFLETKVLIG